MSKLPSYHKTTKKASSLSLSLLGKLFSILHPSCLLRLLPFTTRVSNTLVVGGRSYSRLQEVVGFRRKQQFKPAKVRGFTIVELLIVIVVIGILAAISIVAYNTISQKANNAAIIQAASNSLKVIQAYIAQEGKYPVTTTGQACITIDSGCADSNIAVTAGSTLHTEIQKVGGLPKGTTRLAGTTRYGVIYDYRTRNFNGDSQPVILLYYLQGTGQQCGIPGVTNQSAGDMVGSTSGYTTADSGGKTACVITIPGPAA